MDNNESGKEVVASASTALAGLLALVVGISVGMSYWILLLLVFGACIVTALIAHHFA